MKSRVLVVDDEPLARRGLLRLLAGRKDIEVVGECRNGREAVASIEDLAPDLVLLDVEMPELNGIEVLRVLDVERPPVIVFVTAFDQFAIQAFDEGAADYVLKPVDPKRFEQALDRALDRVRAQPTEDPRLDALLARLESREPFATRLVLREGRRVQIVPLDDIDWIEAADNYVRVHVGERVLLHRATLGQLEERLDPQRFVRIHRSTLVHLDRVREMEPIARGDARVRLADGTWLTVSRRQRARLDDLLRGDR